MTLDIKHVESFVAVAETQSFSLAASHLHTVQSGVSAHIRLLERRLDRELISRGRGRSVSLTPEGKAFLVQARRLLALADEMTAGPPSKGAVPPLRLGTTATFALSVIPNALASYSMKSRDYSVTVSTARSHSLLEILEDGQIDMAMLFDQGPRPSRVATENISLCWAATESFDTHDSRSFPLAFLEDARDLRRHAFAALDHEPTRKAALITQPDPVGLRAVVLAGLAATILPDVAVVQPLMDVGKKFNLPALPTLPVSIYQSARTRKDQCQILADCILKELRHTR